MRKYLLLLFLLFIPCRAHGQTNIQSGPNNPTFCNPGAYFYNTTTALYQQCGPVNTWTQAGASPPSSQQTLGKSAVIATDPQYAGGANPDAYWVVDATWAGAGAGPSTVTAPDGNFLVTAKLGQICYGILGVGTNNAVLAQGTVTLINSATSIVCSGARTSSATANGTFVIGSDNTAALAAAYTALIAPPNCSELLLPAGYMLVQKSVMNTSPSNCQGFNGDATGVDVRGQGMHSTFIVPTPSFDFTTCATPSCFFGGSTTLTHDLQITGLGFNTNPATLKAGIAFSGASYGTSVAVTQWNVLQSNFQGIVYNSQQNACTLCFTDQAGTSGSGQVYNSVGHVVLDNYSSHGNQVAAGARLADFGGTYGAGPGPAYTVNGIANIFGPDIENTTNTQAGLIMNNAAAVARVYGGRVVDTFGSSQGLVCQSAGEAFLVGGVDVQGSAANGAIYSVGAAGPCILHDDGMTKYTGPTSNWVGQANSTFLVGSEKAAVNLSAQTGNIGGTTLYAVPANNPYGSFRLTYNVLISTAGTSGTLAVNLICTNSVGAFTQPGITTVNITSTAGTEVSGVLACMPAVSTNIQYSVTGIVTPGALSYKLNLRLEPI